MLPTRANKQRIVHYSNRGARYGNLLIQFAQWIAFACEHPGIEVAFLPYWPLHPLSRGTETNPYCIYPSNPADPSEPGIALRALHALFCSRHPRMQRVNGYLVHRLIAPTLGRRDATRLPAAGEVPLGDPRFAAALKAARGDIWVHGYGWRDWALVEKHQDTVRDYLRPPAAAYPTAERAVAALRQHAQTIVGVFIRQGDYRKWRSGDYFLTTAQYIKLMHQIQERFGPDRVQFLIASDEVQDPTDYVGLPCGFAPGRATGPGHYIENIAALSMCDYIATVPSTSGVMPAFFGQVPILPIRGRSSDLLTVPILYNHLFDCLRDEIMAESLK